MEDPLSFSRLEAGVLKSAPDQSAGADGSVANMRSMYTMEFLDLEEERLYIKDLWSRESWRFALTGMFVACNCALNLAISNSREPGSTRPLSPCIAALLAALSVFVTVLLWKSEKCGCDLANWLFERARTPMQYLMILGTLFVSVVASYSTFYACNLEMNAELYVCRTMQLHMGISHEELVVISTLPIFLKFLNVSWKGLLAFTIPLDTFS
jgi:hypothetical protein